MKRVRKDRLSEPVTSGGSDIWRRLLWALIFPRRTQRVSATVPGVVLIALSMGVGVAAYNSASNILFITLSLLLGCLVLSGVLSWLNFRGLHWWLEVDVPMRVGREQLATLHLRNTKRLLPTQGLIFEVVSTSAPAVRELVLRERLDPQEETQLVWSVRPTRRGIERVELAYVGSLYPFGFLRKSIAAKASCEVTVWPAPIEYRRFPVAAWRRAQPGEPVARAGHGGDLLALRQYRDGDSHRLIHWKASARLQRLVVRQFSADNEESFTLWLTVPASLWKKDAQFETLCSFVATLAEDLFKQGQLEAVALGGESAAPVRAVRDLELFFDRLAVLQPEQDERVSAASRPARKNVLTFAPEGSREIVAYVDGAKAATT
jgi:uncharacterized protein (DUF58 family)